MHPGPVVDTDLAAHIKSLEGQGSLTPLLKHLVQGSGKGVDGLVLPPPQQHALILLS